MIQSIHKGRGFRGVLNYVFGRAKSPEIVGGNMYGTDPRALAHEFGERDAKLFHDAVRGLSLGREWRSSQRLPHVAARNAERPDRGPGVGSGHAGPDN